MHIQFTLVRIRIDSIHIDNGEANHNLTDIASKQLQLDTLRAHSDLVNSKRECLFHLLELYHLDHQHITKARKEYKFSAVRRMKPHLPHVTQCVI